MKKIVAVAVLLALGCQSGPQAAGGPADLIVHHAKVITVDANFSIAEAIAIRDGRDDEFLHRFLLEAPHSSMLFIEPHNYSLLPRPIVKVK